MLVISKLFFESPIFFKSILAVLYFLNLEDVTQSHYFFNFILLIFPLILYTMKYNLLL